MASGVIKANVESKIGIVSLQHGNETNNIEAESITLPAYSFKNNQINYNSGKHVTQLRFQKYNASKHTEQNSLLPFLYLNLIPRPGYYSFLFQYSLF